MASREAIYPLPKLLPSESLGHHLENCALLPNTVFVVFSPLFSSWPLPPDIYKYIWNIYPENKSRTYSCLASTSKSLEEHCSLVIAKTHSHVYWLRWNISSQGPHLAFEETATAAGSLCPSAFPSPLFPEVACLWSQRKIIVILRDTKAPR